jgi:hypothetical protein
VLAGSIVKWPLEDHELAHDKADQKRMIVNGGDKAGHSAVQTYIPQLDPFFPMFHALQFRDFQ